MHKWQLELWVVEWGWYLSLLTALFLSECFFLSGLLDYHIHVIIFIIRSHDCQGEKWSRQRVCGLEAQERKEKPEADRKKADLGFCGEVDPLLTVYMHYIVFIPCKRLFLKVSALSP